MIANLFISCLLKLCILLSIKSIYLKQNSMLFFKNEGDVEFLYFFLDTLMALDVQWTVHYCGAICASILKNHIKTG